ncbi:TetR/AcrR family transcriptional regulator [Hyphococcus sp.]|uniref:TetR/AcrR family transcriptional regulator n=1 Tax=Hyphococcus sp. TaxID=2038636 RepID=UPI00208A98B9|nr:MAG: TetR family transcriptional regulator [Marinicaulis sp.]
MARPRTFDAEEALASVMSVFWRNGFEGASMQAIETATGLNKQSLYRLFPDKRSIYLAALSRYVGEELAHADAVLSGPGSAKQRFASLFDGLIALAEKGDRSGCFLCNAATDQAQLDEKTKTLVSASLKRVEKKFRKTLAQSHPYAEDLQRREAMAGLLMAAYFGIRVMTKANAPLRLIKAAANEAVAKI